MKKDKVYQEAFAQPKEVFTILEELDLTEEQKRVVDQVITANNHTGAIYGAMAYRCGMEVGIRFQMEMEKIISFP